MWFIDALRVGLLGLPPVWVLFSSFQKLFLPPKRWKPGEMNKFWEKSKVPKFTGNEITRMVWYHQITFFINIIFFSFFFFEKVFHKLILHVAKDNMNFSFLFLYLTSLVYQLV